jgi:hypothetical protein
MGQVVQKIGDETFRTHLPELTKKQKGIRKKNMEAKASAVRSYLPGLTGRKGLALFSGWFHGFKFCWPVVLLNTISAYFILVTAYFRSP